MENKIKQLGCSCYENSAIKNTLNMVYKQLQPDHCFVASLKPGADQMDTLYHLAAGQQGDSVVYLLAGSPCQQLLSNKELVSYAADVQQSFPTDRVLKKFKAQAFIGSLLYDDDNQEIGLLVCLFKQPVVEHTAAVDWLLTLSHISTQQGG